MGEILKSSSRKPEPAEKELSDEEVDDWMKLFGIEDEGK
jgi:hypothetical protein